MVPSNTKGERYFYEGCSIICYGFSTLKGSIQGREVNMLINLDYNENYININFANQLLIPEPNIIEKKDIFQIKKLQLTIDEYEYISQFYVTTMYKEEIDIIMVDDYSCVRHPPGHRPEREPLRWVCGSYLRQSWNVVIASSLQRVEKNSK
jgi:hypothetical protein